MSSLALLKRFIPTSLSSSSIYPISISYISARNSASASLAEDEATVVCPIPRESPGFSDGLHWALAGKGVIVKDKVFRNLHSSELQQHGAIISESLSGLPVRVRGHVFGEASEISRAQYSKLLKQVTNHISSISKIFVHDGAIGLSPKYDAKVRIISDSPSAVLSLSNILWKTPSRAVSHDSCPLTLYVATSISVVLYHAVQMLRRVSVLDLKEVMDLSLPILRVHHLFYVVKLLRMQMELKKLFLPCLHLSFLHGEDFLYLQDTVRSCADLLLSADAGVILSSDGVATLFPNGSPGDSNLFKLPAAVIITSSDSSGVIPLVSKLSPAQAAYHFLAGYQKGKFMPAYSKGPSSFDALELAKAFLSKLKENEISSFLVNVSGAEKRLTGKDFIKLVESALSEDIPPFQAKGSDLQKKYKNFLSGKFQELPEEFSF
ncbi:uncharacterized protein LOC107414837 isoform X2 [Ziziphus jujuba]|uniref:phosphoenolpyruvate carboxykinase (ATP) n=1 Tax=Ziziphus jujuba TaxID=326968 RepID=A0ABM3IE97_ZIZJJ|nr:uncharacterized protein LOC107414837 isoform X2 [Ziziphus jujuba]